MQEPADWFENWFDSPYYHLLYRHRDTVEAREFLDRLISRIPFHKGATVLDVACGKGRHSIYLNSKGFDVTGFDLSEKSIEHNLDYENDRLHFYRHDMREVFRVNYFDYVVNLFSSFGYFESDRDNLHALRSSVKALKRGGTFVLDYANSIWIRNTLVQESEETADGILFKIRKRIREPFVEKEIQLTDGTEVHHYLERLRLFEPEVLTDMMQSCGLEIKSVYGDYDLQPFEPLRSSRTIVVAVKK
ncbi:MAG: hypothetical protein RL021_2191 [Bacteroidota bacterium]|jgi:SAM-dependent methyltransferase